MSQAENVLAPYDRDQDDDFGVRKFTCGTTHSATALPDSWRKRWVCLRAVGGNVHWGVSKASDAEIDRAVSATANGASAKVGGIVPDGINFETHRMLPDWGIGNKGYLVRESDAADTVLYVELTDSPVG